MPASERNGINHCTLETLTTPCRGTQLIGKNVEKDFAKIQSDPDGNWLSGLLLGKGGANDGLTDDEVTLQPPVA